MIKQIIYKSVILFLLFTLYSSLSAQNYDPSLKVNWGLLDPETDKYEGTRTNKLYKKINEEGLKHEEIVVAVMDSGFDIEHPYLKDNIWKNEAELNGQPGVDDDNNGYIDDFYGWNFLGEARYLNLEVTRELARLTRENVPKTDPYFIKVLSYYSNKKSEDISTLDFLQGTADEFRKYEKILEEGNYPTSQEEVKKIEKQLTGKYQEAAKNLLSQYLFLSILGFSREELDEYENDYILKAKYLYDTSDVCSVIGDNAEILDEKGYGNNDIKSKGDVHGTHVTGIIASTKEGVGQAPFAKIMCLRVVPQEGDERDKDIANGIIYAVDNGAKIINLSAGKYFSRNPETVKDAIKYAESKDVLFVVSAGNELVDIWDTINYPVKFYKENGQIKYFDNTVVVGANSWMKTWSVQADPDYENREFDLLAPFSNFSKKVVDLYAPGVHIYSTVPEGKFRYIGGTSMAAPQVSGIAAILRAYFPSLTAKQVKEILLKSVRTYDNLKVRINDEGKKVLFSNLSKTGGVIDAYNAFLIAEQYTNGN